MEQNRINYLLNLASVCENDAIKSFLLFKSVRASSKEGFRIPERFKNVVSRCPKCLLERSADNYTCRLRPEAKAKFARKLLRKVQLTKYQAKYLRNHRRKHDEGANRLVIQCGKCLKTVERSLQKPKTEKPASVNKEERKKGGRKKSDVFAGLKRDAVASSNAALTLKQKLALKRARKEEAARAIRQSEKAKAAKKSQVARGLSKLGNTSTPRKGLRDFLNSL